MLRKVVLTFESVDKILNCNHSNESYWVVFSSGTVYYAVQGGSNFWVRGWNPKVWPFKWKLLSITFPWYCLLCCTRWFLLLSLCKLKPQSITIVNKSSFAIPFCVIVCLLLMHSKLQFFSWEIIWKESLKSTRKWPWISRTFVFKFLTCRYIELLWRNVFVWNNGCSQMTSLKLERSECREF